MSCLVRSPYSSGPQRRRLGATERRHRQPYLEHQEPAALPSTATHHTFHPRLLHGRRRDELSMKVAADLFKNPAAGGAVQDPVAGGAVDLPTASSSPPPRPLSPVSKADRRVSTVLRSLQISEPSSHLCSPISALSDLTLHAFCTFASPPCRLI
jgi:hypothetical protein